MARGLTSHLGPRCCAGADAFEEEKERLNDFKSNGKPRK